LSRRYFDTQQKVFNLFKKHPVMSIMLDDFGILDNTEDTLKSVCDFLLINDEVIQSYPLSGFYNESDLIDELANIYGYDTPPWSNYVGDKYGTNLTELLNFTLYLYKFLTNDNFYEKNLITFIPEYDREQIQAEPKLLLTIESLGKKLDDMENKIIRIKDTYNIDECPDEILDYLGQNIGYEKEEFTLSNVSFRELLKNIIEIYKIKGTNYSFSFFFKFLGFNINLKEFYFNRDVENPGDFPNAKQENIEYYLSTTNPLFETSGVLKPAKFLGDIKNLNDWELEYQSLINSGCTNPSAYMRGLESWNNLGDVWHSNPWTYFKSNLMEYNLEPFVTRMGLTTADNDTIKKYIKFLSPTYLFTWININLLPWEDSIEVNIKHEPYEDDLLTTIINTLGDARPVPIPGSNPAYPDASTPGFEPPYHDYEDLEAELNLFQTTGENLFTNIINNLNKGEGDILGNVLRHDGTYSRSPTSPLYTTGITHSGNKRLIFERISIDLKHPTDEEYLDYSDQPYPALPLDRKPFNSKNVYTSNIVSFQWEPIDGATGYRIQVSTNNNFSPILIDEELISNSFTTTDKLHNNIYYWRVCVKNELLSWGPWSIVYSFNVITVPFPFHNELINEETINVVPVYNSENNFIGADINIKWGKTIQNYLLTVDDGEYITSQPNYIIRLFNGNHIWKWKNLTTDIESTEYWFTVEF